MDYARMIEILLAIGSIPGVPKAELTAEIKPIVSKFIKSEKARTGLELNELFEDTDLGLTDLELELEEDLAKGE